MSNPSKYSSDFIRHETIRAKCVHPTGTFVEFGKAEIQQSIPKRFEQQVCKYPYRLAIKGREHEFSYHELNEVANRLARGILKHRGEIQEPIALLFEHSAWAIAAIFGVLKSGKFYVPLDPSYPRARIRYILEDSQAGLIITNNKNFPLARESAQDAMQIINIDTLDSSFSTKNLGLSISPDDFAYIIYTSGSTGKPKGVLENHRNVLHSTMIFTNNFHICMEDKLSLLESLSFSGSVADIFTALLNGAALLPFDLREEGVGNMADWLIQEGVTSYGSVSMVFRHFAETLTGEEQFPRLRLIRLGGDRMYKTDVELYKRHFSPDCILHNGYGASEVKVICLYLLDKESEIAGSIVPVGYAVEDIEVLLLDSGKAVGINQLGEIVVKSLYISPGYWRKPELTQAKFLPDPAGGDERIYLTGDLGRMLPDGRIIHLGRRDFQLKIRGHRIEVAEIETALLNLDTIKEAVVVAREDSHGDQRLVAYLVPVDDSRSMVSMLRRALSESLPDYMIPSVFVMMDALPLTPSGKIDRMALPEPDMARPELDTAFAAPRTPVENKLADIWSGVLELDAIGIHDNFFDLGGHSLLAVRVFNQIEKVFHKKLPLVTLLHAPTIGQLADIVSQKEWSPPLSSLVAIQPDGSKRPFFCVHTCDVAALFYTDLACHLGQEQPFYALRAQGLDEGEVPHTHMVDMATHCIKEIKTIQPEGPYSLGGGSVGGMIAYEIAQQLLAQHQSVGLLVLIDTASPRRLSSISNLYTQKSLGHYVRRPFHHLRHGQPIFILKDIIRKRYRKIALMFRSRNIRRVRNAIEMVSWSYIPGVYPGQITYFLSEKRKRELGGDQAAVGDWYELAAGGLDVFHVPGDHLDILKEPHVQIVAEHLGACLDEAQEDVSDIDHII